MTPNMKQKFSLSETSQRRPSHTQQTYSFTFGNTKFLARYVEETRLQQVSNTIGHMHGSKRLNEPCPKHENSSFKNQTTQTAPLKMRPGKRLFLEVVSDKGSKRVNFSKHVKT
jgi:hypothetical protein